MNNKDIQKQKWLSSIAGNAAHLSRLMGQMGKDEKEVKRYLEDAVVALNEAAKAVLI